MKSIKKSLAIACIGAFVLGCSPNRPEETPKVSIVSPGMPICSSKVRSSKELNWKLRKYLDDLMLVKSDKSGLKPKLSIDGNELVYLRTDQGFYGHIAKKLGLPIKYEKDENGKEWCSVPTSHLVKYKLYSPLKHLRSPGAQYFDDTFIIEYDVGVDQKPDLRLTVYEDIRTNEIIQELDIGADGTIEERLIFNEYEGKLVSHEVSPGFKKIMGSKKTD